LSIDGGGMRGLIPAVIINYLCEQPELKGYEPYEIFDEIGGTSIGGILALALTGKSNKNPKNAV
jgi:patatin-like phospholipase/acyl hydrolase